MKLWENHDEKNRTFFNISNVENAEKSANFSIEVSAVQKHVSLVDLVKSFQTNIYL